jgi:hypothetical protein
VVTQKNGSLVVLHDWQDPQAKEEQYLQEFQTKETVLGPEHPSTLGTSNNFGDFYADQVEPAKAEQIHVCTEPASEHVMLEHKHSEPDVFRQIRSKELSRVLWIC